MAKRENFIRWTDDECAKVAEAFKKEVRKPEWRHVQARYRNAQVVRRVQTLVLPKNRWRTAHAAAVLKTLEPWINPPPPPPPEPVVVAPKPGEQVILTPLPPATPLPVVAGQSLDQVIQDAMKAMGEAVARHIGWQIAQTVEKVVASMVVPIIEKKLAAMQPVGKDDLTAALDQVMEEHKQIIVQATEPVPEEAIIKMAPRDRKPRVAVIGLMRQQEEDVMREFGDVIDFTFIPNAVTFKNIDLKQRLQNNDVIIVMIRFCSHWHDDHAKSTGVPVMRITGAVSMLKQWLQKWFNGEVGLAGLPPQDHRKEA